MFLLTLRNRHFLILDCILLSLTPYLGLTLLQDDLVIPRQLLPGLVVYTLFALTIRLFILKRLGIYARYWRYAGVDEMTDIGLAIGAAAAIIVLTYVLARYFYVFTFARMLLFLETMLAFLAVAGTRFGIRLLDENRYRINRNSGQRVMIVGATDTGTAVARELLTKPQMGYKPVGFLDDDRYKLGVYIHGLPVLGNLAAMPELAQRYQIEQIIIALPTASGKVIREIVELCEQLDLKTKIMPGIHALLQSNNSVYQLRDVEVEDLLRRDTVHTDIAAVRSLVQGQRVLITGGGGSIGSELCRQVLSCKPSELILLGHGENSIFESYQQLSRLSSPDTVIKTLIADIRSCPRLEAVFAEHRPDIVFHAAAHKHVTLMEQNPTEAISNNVFGTKNLLEIAQKYAVQRLVMISTDKAVNPGGVMGASKRVAELLVRRAALDSGRPYVVVRFGNVLGSRGSVIPVFKQQIANGGPITVTHPEVKRYFMTIPEAVQLVMQAAVLGHGGEVFMLDMGEPVRIVDLAKDLIELSGLRVGQDIDIVFSGLRPGEKLSEELSRNDRYLPTLHEKIFIAETAESEIPYPLEARLQQLQRAVSGNDTQAILRSLNKIIPEFQPVTNESVPEPILSPAVSNGLVPVTVG